jgi:hypothetical protein
MQRGSHCARFQLLCRHDRGLADALDRPRVALDSFLASDQAEEADASV